jgi:hypothetical protein
MKHSEVFTKFHEILNPGDIEIYLPNGYNSIRIRFENGPEVVFTYENDTKWRLEPVSAFIDRIKN